MESVLLLLLLLLLVLVVVVVLLLLLLSSLALFLSYGSRLAGCICNVDNERYEAAPD